MARELLVVWAGRHRRDDWDRLCDRYRERIERLTGLREVVVRVRGGAEGRERLAAEAEAIEAALPDPCWTVALDRRGRTQSSRALARRLQRLEVDWPHPVAFLLGSDLGLDRDLLDRCRQVLSFGPMTFPHELARLMLYEQIYRALAIGAGIKYHRDPF